MDDFSYICSGFLRFEWVLPIVPLYVLDAFSRLERFIFKDSLMSFKCEMPILTNRLFFFSGKKFENNHFNPSLGLQVQIWQENCAMCTALLF